MRMIVLWARADELALVVVVILVAEIPVQAAIYFQCKSHLGGLVGHRVGRNQITRTSSWIGEAGSLTIVIIDTI